MLDELHLICGTVLLTICLLDALWTTVVPHGAGPVTAMVSRFSGRVITRLPTAVRPLVYRLSGPLVLLTILNLWLVFFWAGWWAVFSSNPDSVVHSVSGEPADAVTRAYFVGYSISTLGLGDYVPSKGVWELLTAIAALGGLILITLSISYLIPVLAAATQKRVLGAMIRDLGCSAQSLITSCWDGSQVRGLTPMLLDQVWPRLELHSQRHLAYPVLHYFRVPAAQDSLAVGLARLYETVLLLRYAVAEQAQSAGWQLNVLERSIASFLEHLAGRYVEAATDPPPLPDTAALREIGIPLRDDTQIAASFQGHACTRSLAAAVVIEAGWTWRDVTNGSKADNT